MSSLAIDLPIAGTGATRPGAAAGAIVTRKAVLSRRVVEDIAHAATVLLASAAAWAVAAMSSMLPVAYSFAAFQAAALALACLVMFGQLVVTMREDLAGMPVGREAAFLAAGAALAAGTAALAVTAEAMSATSILVSLLVAGATGLAAATSRIAFASAVAFAPLSNHFRRRVAIYGASQDSARIFEQLARNAGQYNVIGLFDGRQDVGRQTLLGIPVVGDFNDLEAIARAGCVDEIIIALPHWASERTETLGARLAQYPVDVHVPVAAARDLPRVDQQFHLSRFGEIQLAHVQNTPLRDWGLVAKVLQDRVGGALLLLALSPVLALIAAAIKLDSAGPVFFRQKRHGLCGREITVWKFRTMRVLETGAVVSQATKGDPRVTRVGRLLRKSSLDELPQLINVVCGQMSIVGPRPHAVAHNQHYALAIAAYNGRNQMKPGITGWAQINGYRGETRDLEAMEQRVEHDLWYIRNWSPWLDIKIILMTPIYGLFHRNAY